MGLSAGDWVLLHDGAVGRIAEIDEPGNQVLAERIPGGEAVERPLTFATMYWTVLNSEGLAVQRATAVATLREQALRAPANIVVAALIDAGGEATSEQLRERITPDPVNVDAWERWWRRVQPRLDHHPRIDATRAREKRYRLLREGERPLSVLRPVLQSEERLGRLLADAPQLREARKIARSTAARSDEELELLRREAEIARDVRVDPTDRFLAAELATWIGHMTADEARSVLADDVLSIDLLRVPSNDSRQTAFEWAIELLGEAAEGSPGSVNTLASAVAAGDPWAARVLAAFVDAPVTSRRICEGFLGWGAPGSEEAGPAKFPDDLQTFERRISRAREALPGLSPDQAAGFFLGALRALEVMPDSSAHAKLRERVLRDCARAAWQARAIAGPSAPRLDERGAPRPEALRILADMGTSEDLKLLERVIAPAFLRAPIAYASVFEYVARRLGRDPVAGAVDVAREAAARTGIRAVALHALAWAVTTEGDNIGEVASLAGTIAPDDLGVRQRLEDIARNHAEAAIRGQLVEGSVFFSRASWRVFIGQMLDRIETAISREREANQRMDRLAAEVVELESALAQRSEALSAVRMESGAATRGSSQRMAMNVLKPVALAVADAYEGQSLEALLDRLLAVLARARLRPVGDVGSIQEYDPERHMWVGDGAPGDEVELISPGFLGTGDEDREITLVPARVVAPR